MTKGFGKTSQMFGVVIFLSWLSFSASLLFADEKNTVEFRLAVDTPQEGYEEATLSPGKQKIYLAPDVIISKKDIISVAVDKPKKKIIDVSELPMSPGIAVHLSKLAGERFKKFTGANLNKRVAIVVKGKVIFAPIIRVPISDRIVISGSFSDDEVAEIVNAMSK